MTTTSKKSRKELSPARRVVALLHQRDSHPEATPRGPLAPTGDKCHLCHALVAPTSAEDAGVFALLDVSLVVEADFHPAAVRLVVERDLGMKGDSYRL